jgi:hypothetical protein
MRSLSDVITSSRTRADLWKNREAYDVKTISKNKESSSKIFFKFGENRR